MALTKAQLEALKNTLLASQQPIEASTHRAFVQNVIDEMYDAQSRGNLLAGVQTDGTTAGGDTILLIRSGEMFLVPSSLFGTEGTLAGLSDVVIIDEQEGDILSYNAVEGVWENIVASSLIFQDVLLRTTDQSFTGVKSATNTGSSQINGLSLTNNGSAGQVLLVNNASTGLGIYSDNSSTGTAIYANNSSSGNGIISNNSSSGKGILSSNNSNGAGIFSDNITSGNGIVSNGKTAATGFNYVGQNNGANTFTVNKFGTVTAPSFVGALTGLASGNLPLAGGTLTGALTGTSATLTVISGTAGAFSGTGTGIITVTQGASQGRISSSGNSLVLSGASGDSSLIAKTQGGLNFPVMVGAMDRIVYGNVNGDIQGLSLGSNFSLLGGVLNGNFLPISGGSLTGLLLGTGATFSSLAGSDDVIVFSNTNGVLGKMAIGSGLSFSGGTLSATGGSAGTVTGSGTAGFIPKWTGADLLGNSILSESGSTLTVNGTAGTLRLGTNTDDYLTLNYAGGGSSIHNEWYNTSAFVDILANGVGIRVKGNGNVGIGTTSPAESALLDLTSTSKALLLTRLTTAQRDAMTAVNGMIIYNTSIDACQIRQDGIWENVTTIS
jgi:hypothetical protein